MKRIVLRLVLCFMYPLAAGAQVNWGAIYDFEFRKGGDGSSLERNEVINSNAYFSVHRFQLFMDAAIDDRIAFTAKLANNIVIGDKLKELEIQLAYVTFSGIGGYDFNVSMGRILTPFGLFAKRQLSPDNPLIGSPLYFQYQVNVSSKFGYRPQLATGDIYGGLSTMYLGGYYVGTELFGSIFNKLLDYDLALMNAPISTFNSDSNTNKGLSFHGRVGIQPALYLSFGASGSYGSFMDQSLENRFLEDLEQYKQLSLGFDVAFDWKHYKVVAEYISNRWKSPYIVIDYTVSPPYNSGLSPGVELDLVNRELLVDLKIDLPFLVGAYVAGRWNLLEFDTIDDPRNPGTSVAWASRVRRYAAGIGYKVSRMVLLKAGYEWTLVDSEPRPYLNMWGGQVSVVI